MQNLKARRLKLLCLTFVISIFVVCKTTEAKILDDNIDKSITQKIENKTKTVVTSEFDEIQKNHILLL